VKTAGIDGCRGGWILATFTDGEEKIQVINNNDALIVAFNYYDRVLIDMPIGLEDQQYTRECDRLLRKRLGAKYSSSVFSPPIRQALNTSSYQEASVTSFKQTKKKLSLQAWNITPKIIFIDALLQEKHEFKTKVLESHPELLFQELNRGIIPQKKNSKEGIQRRLELLSAEELFADDFFRIIKEKHKRSEVREDDILDSMVLAYYAKQSIKKGIKTIPLEVEYDSKGLPKAIHFA